jgi:hypothetical protein
LTFLKVQHCKQMLELARQRFKSFSAQAKQNKRRL